MQNYIIPIRYLYVLKPVSHFANAVELLYMNMYMYCP